MNRKQVNEAYRQKKKSSKTVTQSLNEFRKGTSLANFRFCVQCEEYFTSLAAIEIKTTDPLYGELNLIEKEEMKILNSFWLCLVCKSSTTKREQSLSDPMMKSIQVGGCTILYPSNDNDGENIEITNDTLILFPKSYSGGKYEKNWNVKLYNNQEPTNRFISTLYKMRSEKFAARQLFSDFYTGEIQQQGNKKLQSISKVIDDSMIRSSSTWISKRKNAIFSNFVQYGNMAVGFSLDINSNNAETVLTSLLCSGTVMSLDYEGDVNDEYRTKYNRHNHAKNVTCNPNCNTTEITEIPEFLETKFFPIYISSISQKQAGFIESFVKNQNFELFSEHYFCGIDFDMTGKARVNGLLWSYECDIFNREMSSTSLNGNNLDPTDFLQYLEKSILTTVNKVWIQENLGVNEEESNKIQNLAEKYQVKLNMKEKLVRLPSFETMMKVKPNEEARVNLISSKRLLKILKNCLLQLSEEEKKSLTAEEWLESMARNAKFELLDDSHLCIIIQDTTIIFYVDERLDTKITNCGAFTALYHYSLSCSNKEYSVVMKRLHVLDCYTVPYNKTLLKAFQDSTEIQPIYTISEWWEFQDRYSKTVPNIDNLEICELLTSHDLISLPEMYALSDPVKIRDIVSAKIEYISPYEEQRPQFRKLRVSSDTSYELPGRGHFELLSNNVARHFSRLNGVDLLLIESTLWYDVLSKKDGSEIQSLYKEKLERIPNGDVISINGTPLPTYILCSNGQTLKLRRKRKCLQIPQLPRLSKEEKYARVLIFYPLKPGQIIDTERIGIFLLIH